VAKHVLITGFEPFGGDKINPSEIVARSLEGRMIAGRPVAVHVLPVETRSMRERLEAALQLEDPDIIIATAQFGGRTALSLERVAVNVLDFEAPDNVGVMRKGDAIVRGGADARISNLPFDRAMETWRQNGVPGYVSNSAGTFVGNQVLYELLGLTEYASSPVITGLLHLPYLPAQAIEAGADSNPSMSLELMKKGIETLIETVVPWVEHRTPEAAKAKEKGRPMWIPRGVKEAER
jgi:pyroglutamyl-peptidase